MTSYRITGGTHHFHASHIIHELTLLKQVTNLSNAGNPGVAYVDIMHIKRDCSCPYTTDNEKTYLAIIHGMEPMEMAGVV